MHSTLMENSHSTLCDQTTTTYDGDLPLARLPPAIRVSRLPPTPTIPSWGRDTPSGPSRQRYFFVAVRRGHQTGVYTSWPEAEKQIIDHPCPSFKTFSTKLAAEAYVAGWDGAGRHSLPSSTPRPLREHLAMNFPHAVPLPSITSTSRPSYHARLLSAPSAPDSEMTDFAPAVTSPRPDLQSSRPASYRHSLVKISSPLRQQVDETDAKPAFRKTNSMMNLAGLLSPPASPDFGPHPPPVQNSIMNRERPIRGKSITETGTWSSTQHKHFALPSNSKLPSPPQSPLLSPAKKPLPKRTASGMWADSIAPAKPTPTTPSPSAGLPEVDFAANLAAPKFSRSALKKAGVVMPVSAPRSSSSSSAPSLRSKTSTPSLRSLPSSSSLSSLSSLHSNSKSSRKQSSRNPQDRLSSLAETSKKELQLNEEGLLALDALSPPRPAFMHRKSNSSLSSLSSMTSATSEATSTLDSCAETPEMDAEVKVFGNEENDGPISCTKSDADADGSIESTSMKSGFTGKEKKKGGLFKRLTKALKLEKKSIPGHDAGRRGSL